MLFFEVLLFTDDATAERTSKNMFVMYDMSLVLRKPDFCICENKAADQLCGSRTTDQRLCFRDMDSSIPLLVVIFCDCTA